MQEDSLITREGVKISQDISIQPPTPTHISNSSDFFLFLAATKQLYEWFSLSVRLSHLFHYVPIMISWNFQVLLPMADVSSMQKARGQRSSSQSWNNAQSLMLLMRGALFFFNVIRQISRSHG